MGLGEPGATSSGMTSGTIRTIQLLLAGVILFGSAVVTVTGRVSYPALLALGTGTTLFATAIAVLVPWRLLPRRLAAIIPAIDILAIGLVRHASPTSGLGLLWAFPAMWAAWAFGLPGALLATAVISAAYWALTFSGTDPVGMDLALLFPATIAVLALVTYVVGRRSQAQYALLRRQSASLQRAMSRARQQESLVTEVLDAVDFGVVGIDDDGGEAISNAAYHRLRRLQDDAGEDIYAADGYTPIGHADEPLNRMLRGERVGSALVWYGRPGSPQRIALLSTALRAEHGRGDMHILVTRDVTQEQLALRSRDDLVASVSHELRTPLTSIVGYIELASDDPDLSEASRRSLAIAERNSERLLELVTDVLAISATSRMGLDLRIVPAPADVADLVHAAVEAAEVRAADRRIEIDSSGAEPAVALIDAHRIRQVVDNLIGNAIKYGREGGRIDVGCTADGEHVWVVVRDDGPGIAPEELARVFDRFFRSEGVRKSSVHGSGLGLAISRDIVRAHGGDITVRSSLGEGATFIVRLPIPMTDPE